VCERERQRGRTGFPHGGWRGGREGDSIRERGVERESMKDRGSDIDIKRDTRKERERERERERPVKRESD